MTDRDPEIQELLDKQAIREVMSRYCRGVDRCDAELLSSAYHPDAFDDRVSRKFTGETVGPGIVEWIKEITDLTTHHITTQTIAVNGDTAVCESYYIGIHVPKDGAGQLMLSSGRYLDRLERRAGEWRISKRAVVLEASRRFPPGGEQPSARPTLARRDPSDPSYAFFEGHAPGS